MRSDKVYISLIVFLLAIIIGCIGPASDYGVGKKHVNVKLDMRETAIIIERYFSVNKKMPGFGFGPDSVNKQGDLPSFLLIDLNSLQYIGNIDGRTNGLLENRLFRDPFAAKGCTFCYYNFGKKWMLWSPGPDGDYDIDLKIAKETNEMSDMERYIHLSSFMYDSTNGSYSKGDIIRLSQ
ncbi:hypothetical protein JXA32_09210 [Candidatus Sumerlaeota bacterium]|nr:hypothetical protein [Candidatus Sumerlaeota bacterium]